MVIIRKISDRSLGQYCEVARRRDVVWVGPTAGVAEGRVRHADGPRLLGHEFRERGLFDVAEVRRAWKKFRGGDSKNAFFVWQWVNTELWFRRFADGRADILNVA